MRQITQNRKTGKITIHELPGPGLMGPGVLVNNRCSLISAGTERQMIEFANKSLVGKAQSRPDLVRQVIERVKREGLRRTWELVQSQLDVEMPMGYSSAGQVLLVSPEVTELKPGDRVACAGTGYASHAGLVYVPRRLVTAIPDGVSYEEASFVTLGAIAMQGLRQADLRLGERVCVIGLGLLGLLTVQMVRAAGCRVLGMDLDVGKREMAARLGCDAVCGRGELPSRALEFSDGRGVDAVIITAATPSNDPVEVSADICRLKGRVVVVGLVGMSLPRDAYYKKELDLRLSMSYGPGRKDPAYEERGHDYPYSYVRFTEQRNMQVFLELIRDRKVEVQPLVTHRYPVEKGHEAYDLVTGKSAEPFIGVMLEYPEETPAPRIELPGVAAGARQPVAGQVGVAVIGAGSLANLLMLPVLARMEGIRRVGIADAAPAAAKAAAAKFGFAAASGEPEELIHDPAVQAIFVATRHGSHASLVLKALAAGKHVFVEKPLAMNWDELRQIVQAAEARPDLIVQVGFNRRFAPLTAAAREFFAHRRHPLVISYLANAGYIPPDHWVHDPVDGGGRIIGEACHFIDWGLYLSGSRPRRVTAASASGGSTDYVNDDCTAFTVETDDGSLISVQYIADGPKAFDKETAIVLADQSMFTVRDWYEGETVGRGPRRRLKLSGKGHAQEFAAFVDAIRQGSANPVALDEAVYSTAASFAVVESLRSGLPADLETWIHAD
jgi:polar amino acid transport system substrate-binding protein